MSTFCWCVCQHKHFSKAISVRDALHTAGPCLWISDLALFKREGTSLIPEKEMQDTVFMCPLSLSSTAVCFAAVHAIDLIPSVNFPNLDYLSSAQKHTLNSLINFFCTETLTICFHHSSAAQSYRRKDSPPLFFRENDSLVPDSLNMQNTQNKRQSHFPVVELFVNVMH